MNTSISPSDLKVCIFTSYAGLTPDSTILAGVAYADPVEIEVGSDTIDI